MNINYNSGSTGEIQYTDKNEVYTSPKFKKINILIFALCLFLAFVFWCYALYVDDPIIEKTINVNFVLVNGIEGEYIAPSSKKITVYGEKSLLSNVNSITIKVDRSEFKEYDRETSITLQYPKNIRSETKQLNLTLSLQSE